MWYTGHCRPGFAGHEELLLKRGFRIGMYKFNKGLSPNSDTWVVTLATGPYFLLEAAEMGQPRMILKPCNKPHFLKEGGNVPWDTVPLLVSLLDYIS